ncbi:NAD-dependent DNA ligase [Bacillus thuringiensis]|nr:NAD-dependent DNA ligase [Bacillus thuringiensis]
MSKGIEFEIGSFLGEFDVTDYTMSQVEKLEDYIEQANTIANMKTGELLVVDAIYNEMVSILRQVKPDSHLLTELWETGDEDNVEGNQYTDLLVKNPMKSILTVKSFNSAEMGIFKSNYPEDEPVTLHGSLKENGWGIRIAYMDGEYVSATSRSRASAGKDLTRQVGVVLEKKGLLTLEDVPDGLAEVRGELLLSFNNLDEARAYNPNIVSAFSGVASMARDSASEEENALLDFVAYTIIHEDLEFESKSEEYRYLKEYLGFEVPLNWTIEDVTIDELEEVLEDTLAEIEEEVFNEAEPYEYFTDGVVIQIDDYATFHALGDDGGKYNKGNIALKVGAWSQDNYYGYVQYIDFSKGKSKLSPVAILGTEPNQAVFEIDDEIYQGLDEVMEYHDIETLNFNLADCVKNYKDLGVGTASGNKVRRVPLYEVANMILLGITPNSILYFKYGGEAGVVPCREDGSLIKDIKGVNYIDGLFTEEDIIGSEEGEEWA